MPQQDKWSLEAFNIASKLRNSWGCSVFFSRNDSHTCSPVFCSTYTELWRRGEKGQADISSWLHVLLNFFLQKLKRNRWGWKTGKTTPGPSLLSSVHYTCANYFHKREGSTSKVGEEVLRFLHTHQAYRISHAVGTCLEVLGLVRILNTHWYPILSQCFQNTRRDLFPYSFSSSSLRGVKLSLNALLPLTKAWKGDNPLLYIHSLKEEQWCLLNIRAHRQQKQKQRVLWGNKHFIIANVSFWISKKPEHIK